MTTGATKGIGTTEDVAKAVAFLAWASYLNGMNLQVDGGFSKLCIQ